MQERVEKDAVLQQITTEQQYWLDLIAQINPRTPQRTTDDCWSLRELLNHMVVWRNRTMAVIEAEAFGRSKPPDSWPANLGTENLNGINAWIDKHPVSDSIQQLIDDYTASFNRMADFVSQLSESDLNDQDLIPLAAGKSPGELFQSGVLFQHLHEEHLADFQSLITSSS